MNKVFVLLLNASSSDNRSLIREDLELFYNLSDLVGSVLILLGCHASEEFSVYICAIKPSPSFLFVTHDNCSVFAVTYFLRNTSNAYFPGRSNAKN